MEPTTAEMQARAWIESQLGPLLMLPDVCAAARVPVKAREIASALVRAAANVGAVAYSDFERISKDHGATTEEVMTVMNCLCAGEIFQMTLSRAGVSIPVCAIGSALSVPKNPRSTPGAIARATNFLRETLVQWRLSGQGRAT